MPPDAQTAATRHTIGQITDPVSVHFDVIVPPEGGARATIVMIHGGSHTGNCYLRTPDGRPGWAYRFAGRGYRAVTPDWPGCGRSGALAPEDITGETMVRGLGALIESLPQPVIVMTHSMSGAYGWRLLERHGARIACLVGIAPSPPGNIQAPAEITRETADEIEGKGLVFPFRLPRTGHVRSGQEFVVDKLIGGSRLFPRDRIDGYWRTLSATPARLLYERQNIKGSQVKVQDPSRLAGKRILVVTGTEDIDHSRAYDEATVAWLQQAGAAAEFVYLGDRGISGNGHMLMLEQNSDAIADLILDWLDSNGPAA